LKPEDWLHCPQAEEVSERVWHPEELDADQPLAWCTRIPHQALCPRASNVRPLRSRLDHRRRRGAVLGGRLPGMAHLDVLSTHTLHAGASMLSPAPVSPEQGCQTDDKRMHQHTDLTRLRGDASLPLARLTHRTETAPADARRRDHAQAPIGLPAPLVCYTRLASRTLEGPIRVEGTVLTGEATLFPGRNHRRRSRA
jgi:hypothetical protein